MCGGCESATARQGTPRNPKDRWRYFNVQQIQAIPASSIHEELHRSWLLGEGGASSSDERKDQRMSLLFFRLLDVLTKLLKGQHFYDEDIASMDPESCMVLLDDGDWI